LKILLFLALLLHTLWGDFYVVSGTEEIRMTELPNGKIDFTELSSIPFVSGSGKSITVRSVNEDLNNRHLNFRTASIALLQRNYVLTEYTTKVDERNHHTAFGDYEINQGRMIQLFYHNRWYGVIIGDPITILHELFNDETLDSRKAYAMLKQARIAFADDATLALYEKLWYERFVIAQEQQKVMHIRDTYALYQETPTPNSKKFYAAQTKQAIRTFLKAHPHSNYTEELNTLLDRLK